MTEEKEELPCFSALLDSRSEPGMTEEDERELSASDGDHESSSPHAARNATMKMDPIAAMRLPPWWPCALGNKLPSAVRQDDSTKNFFINTSLSLTLKIEYSLNPLS